MNLVDHDSERPSPGTRLFLGSGTLGNPSGKGREREESLSGGVGGLPVNKETGRITRANGERFRKEKEREGFWREERAEYGHRTFESLSQPFFRPKSFFFPSSRTITRQIQSNAGSNRILPRFIEISGNIISAGVSEKGIEGNAELEAEWTTTRDRK